MGWREAAVVWSFPEMGSVTDQNLRAFASDVSRDAIRLVTDSRALKLASRSLRDGQYLLLAPGDYVLYDDLAFGQDDIHIIGLGKVNLKAGRDYPTRGASLSLSGDRCVVANIAFDDAKNDGSAAVYMTGVDCKVLQCRFADCRQAVLISGNGALISGNRVEAADTDGMSITGDYARIHGNRVASSGTYDINASGDFAVMTGNITSTFRIQDSGGSSVESGNIGTKTSF